MQAESIMYLINNNFELDMPAVNKEMVIWSYFYNPK